MNIAIAGTGYVGLVTGVCLASKGHFVTCVDTDEKKLSRMRRGQSPIYETGLEELMNRYADQLTYTSDYRSAYKEAEVIFIAVGTPEKRDGSANLSYVYTVAGQIAESLRKDSVIALKSTVPIGTNDKVEAYIQKKLRELETNVKVSVVSNPEFLSQGTAVRDTLQASRIVIGTESEWAEKIMLRVYESFDVPKLVTCRRSAEMIKYASNDFLALKISYINEIANLCETIGADIEEVAEGMGYDSRIGSRFLRSGIGYGGSCFPKDTKALSWLASYNDNEIKTIKAAIEVNEGQKLKLVKKLKRYYDDLEDLKIAVLGLTFKPGTDDLREAPSLVCIPILLEDGAKIQAWDPVGVDNFKKKVPDGIQYCQTIEETVEEADACLIFTEWEEICQFDIRLYKKLMRNPIVIDGRNCYKVSAFDGTGILYDSIGRRCVNR